jgi:uncharacterized membrane protein YidH (DUF202 family)
VSPPPDEPPNRPRAPADVESALDRTDLAWDRSAIALGALGLILLKDLLPSVRSDAVVGIALLIVAGAYGIGAYAYRRHRGQRAQPSRQALAMVAAATAAVGVVGLAIAFVPR